MQLQNSNYTTWTSGFFKIKKLNVDLNLLCAQCNYINEVVCQRYLGSANLNLFKNRSTSLYSAYNIFLFCSDPLHELFEELNLFWNEVKPSTEKYYIQSWLNVYNESSSIGWHSHWPEWCNTYHGFFCVDVDVSKTSYVLKPEDYKTCKQHVYEYNNSSILEYNEELEIVNVVGRDNFLIMAPSAGDMHRNIPWSIEGRPRITIAFDIVPGRCIDNNEWENHWIPLL